MASSKEMKPLGTPFFPSIFIKNQFRATPSTPPDTTDLTSKVALVTGANSGLGLEAADQLLSFKLSSLIIAVRSIAKGEAAAEQLRAKYPKASINVLQVDMSSYPSIQAFADKVSRLPRIDIAILNAGVRNQTFQLNSSTNHEDTIQTNYLSTVLLCILLLPTLQRYNGRMTIVSSGLAFVAKLPSAASPDLLSSFDDPNNFTAENQYNLSKLLGMMFLSKLVEYVSGDNVVVNLVDPGFVAGTGLTKLSGVKAVAFTAFKAIAARSLTVGASTYVDAAVVKGKETHGSYLMSWSASPFPDALYTTEGKDVTERLWTESMKELSFANVDGVLNSMGRQ